MKLLVIGNPIKHSKSPLIHNFWLKEKKINCSYKSLLVNSEDLKGIIQKVKKGEILGINITLPFKEEIQQYLDLTDNNALYTGAINTVYKKNNKVIGTNTSFTSLDFQNIFKLSSSQGGRISYIESDTCLYLDRKITVAISSGTTAYVDELGIDYANDFIMGTVSWNIQ